MAKRRTRVQAWGWVERPLTNGQTADHGEMICVDVGTGLLVIGAVGDSDYQPIGTMDNGPATTTGDGVTPVRVKLFREVWLHSWENDTTTPVVAGDFGSLCYILDASTVTGDADTGTNAPAGRVWGIEASGNVLVEMLGFGAAPLA